jgi:DNA-binding protein H-NS
VQRRLGAGVARYRDPVSGKTWSGFGKAPYWIAGARDRTAFLIDKSTAPGACKVVDLFR